MQEERSEMAAKRASDKASSTGVFGQRRKPSKMFRAGLYACVSTQDPQNPQTIPLHTRPMGEYVVEAGLTIAVQLKEVGSGASQRELQGNVLENRSH